MEFKRINTQQEALYTFFEDLLTSSFPADEYRDLGELRQIADHENRFHCLIVMEAGTPIGLFTYWDFGRYTYAEHFAIHPDHRNGGKGAAVLTALQGVTDTPIVLEVEAPVEEMAKRRICFYRRQGFELWKSPYMQPPYRKGDGMLPMLLMVKGKLDEAADFEDIKRTLYSEVYKV